MKINRKLTRTGLILTLTSVVLAAAFWLAGSVIIAPANRTVDAPPAELNFKSATIESRSGAEIALWSAIPSDATATVLLLHPLRANRRSMLERASLFADSGFGIVLIDMQAHGESAGEYVTAGFLEKHDVSAALSFIEMERPDHRIGVIGCSLGGAAALLSQEQKSTRWFWNRFIRR